MKTKKFFVLVLKGIVGNKKFKTFTDAEKAYLDIKLAAKAENRLPEVETLYIGLLNKKNEIEKIYDYTGDIV